MKFYRATIDVMIAAENENEAADLMSALLTENGIYGGDDMLRDWQYTSHLSEIDVPADKQGNEEFFA